MLCIILYCQSKYYLSIITDKKCYCSVGMNLFYFLIIYHCSLLLSYSSHLVSLLFLCPYIFTFFKFFHYWFLLFSYGIYNFISDSMLYLYLQCTLRYGLDSTRVRHQSPDAPIFRHLFYKTICCILMKLQYVLVILVLCLRGIFCSSS